MSRGTGGVQTYHYGGGGGGWSAPPPPPPPPHHAHTYTQHYGNGGRGLDSFTLELNLSNSRTRSWVKLGYTVDRRAQLELESKRV
jgi:hypothetical protein